MPEDPVLLLSFVNTRLRDMYSDLDEFAAAENIDAALIVQKLSSIDYHYDPNTNQFK